MTTPDPFNKKAHPPPQPFYGVILKINSTHPQLVQAPNRVLRAFQGFHGKSEGGSVLRRHDEIAERSGVQGRGQGALEGQEVALGLGHLLAVDVDERVVNPAVAESLPLPVSFC